MTAPITATTRLCAVYGHPIKHSASPAMHNAALAALGLDWRYLAFDVHPTNLRQAIEGAKAMRFIGLNLTVPHKLLALEMVDVIDPAAKQWGAINTIRFEGRSGDQWLPLAQLPPDIETEIRSVGFNTDADAIIRSIGEDLGLKLEGKRVLILGAGGAGRAAALRIADENPSELYLVNRSKSKAEDVMVEARAKLVKIRKLKKLVSEGVELEGDAGLEKLELAIKIDAEYERCFRTDYPKRQIDLIINCTSLGLNSTDPMPIDQQQFDLKSATHVYDMIYKPATTPLLAAAQAAGCKTANGLGMLLYQGAKALEIWSGKTAPIQIMRKALHAHIYA